MPPPPPSTIPELIAASARRRGDAAALLATTGPAPLSWADLAAHARATAGILARLGVARSDRVAIVLPNGPSMLTAFVGVAHAATAAPLNPAYREPELEFYLDDLDAAALLVEDDAGPAAAVARRRGIPVIRVRPSVASAGAFDLEALADPSRGVAEPDRPLSPAAPDDVALVLHTSGTTSRPKIVPLRHRNVCASAAHIAATLALREDDRCLNVMPLFHIHGLIGATLSTLFAGASIVATPGFRAPSFAGWLGDHRPSWYTAVPTMHQAILARAEPDPEAIRGHGLRLIRSSSASLAPAVLERLEAVFGVPVIESYGMTEAAHQMTSNPLPPRPRKPGSVGPAAGPEVSIVSDDGRHLPTGEIGEVVIRGPNVTAGYAGAPEANDAAFIADGWFRTGDQGRLDEDGYLVLTGRLKEIINRGGETIAPREIDEALLLHEAVAQAVAFAVPDERLGEAVGAAVVLREGARATEGELRAFAAARLSNAKVPAVIVLLDAVPKGPTGKIQRIGMAERLGVGAIDGAAPSRQASFREPGSETERRLAAAASAILAVDRLGVDDDFFAAGGDSLLAAELVARVDDELDVELPLHVFLARPTVAGIAAFVDAERAAGRTTTSPGRDAEDDASSSPLSFPQRAVWVHERLAPGTPENGRAMAIELRGALDAGDLARALARVVARHEPLRTRVAVERGEPRGSSVPAPTEVPLTLDDLGGASPDDRDAGLLAVHRDLARARFDLEAGALLKARLVRLEPLRHALCLGIHHVAFDGSSAALLIDELAAELGGRTVEPLPTRHATLARRQRARAESGELERPLERLVELIEGAPRLGLPAAADAEADAGEPWRGDAVIARLEPAVHERMRRAAGAFAATPFHVFLAACARLLHEVTGRDDVLLGTLVAGRDRPDSRRMIGCLVNEVPVRIAGIEDADAAGLIARARAAAFAATGCADVPLELLVRRRRTPVVLGRHPLTDVFVEWRALPEPDGDAGSLALRELRLEDGVARFELLVQAIPEVDGGLTLRLEHRLRTIDSATAERWRDRLVAIVTELIGPA